MRQNRHITSNVGDGASGAVAAPPARPADQERTNSPGLALGAKAAGLPIAGLAALLSARIVTDELGLAGYALFALITTLPALLPLGDLGAGAALLDAVAADDGSPRARAHTRGTLISGARMLNLAGAAVAATGLVLAGTGTHTWLLGTAATPSAGACVAVAGVLIGCTLPLGLGASALAAIDRYHVALLLQAAGSAAGFGLVVVAAGLDAHAAVYCAGPLAGQCAAGAAALALAARALGMPMLRTVAASVRPGQQGTRIMHLAGPMTVIYTTSALTYGTDRLVLGHTTSAAAVAVYSAGAQLYRPAAALLSSAALPLWGRYVQRRGAGGGTPRGELARLVAWFAGAALVVGGGLVACGPPVADWMLHGEAPVGPGLMAAFGLLILVHAVNHPVGMWLSDAPGLRFQARGAVAMTAVSLALSVPLAIALGPAGPVLASALAFAVCVAVPCHRRAFRHG
ncbi:hypothetical protein G5C51_14410 [Streptomyces sp. A7024]|uniref:Polysaccharide biosynthesis protein n=1 Tax=Streptomyces coryli TaxID=1128680 RepID=A0A6G4TYN1_9ACTN|nr:hypothetical protein [Streptomyces coryli]NGN65085.1 hypothetical protein [Streptomyces coryli]